MLANQIILFEKIRIHLNDLFDDEEMGKTGQTLGQTSRASS